jgi:myosin heavy subunit
VLIATNPFARVDSLYVPGMVQVYAGKQRSSQAPHLFAIAEEAFAYVALVTPNYLKHTENKQGTCFEISEIKP